LKLTNLETYLMRVISKEDKSFFSALVLALLSILEIIYLVLVNLQRGLIKGKQLPVPVASIGNLTVGGTGKTPTVVWLVTLLKQAGYTPAILTRGYRSASQKEGLIFTSSELAKLTPELTGDEPYLLAGLLPETVIAVGRDRCQSALKALAIHPEIDLFVMDDGFQYLKLKRDVDILLLDAVNPFGNGHLIPRGTLREPLAGLKRADVILLTRTAKLAPEDIDGFREYLGKYKTAPIGIVKEEHSQLLPLSRWGQKVSPMAASQYLPGKKVAAITGIGNPAQFLSSLETLGAEVGYFKAYPDHYSWKTEEIANLIVTLTEWGFEDLIVTGKDGVKLEVYLEQFEQMGLNCLILSLEYQVDDQEVTAKIMDRLLRKVEANQ
jgi:tetraacyldisaccharide 4'-kinase